MRHKLGIQYSDYSSNFLEKFLNEVEVSQTQYQAAERSYKSIGDWFNRDNSTLTDRVPKVYVQGSFRLGTAIRPISDDSDLDLDLVCEILGDKTSDSQKDIKELIGYETQLYANNKQITLDKPEIDVGHYYMRVILNFIWIFYPQYQMEMIEELS